MAWPKLTKNANFGPNLVVLGQKILISTGKIKSFVTHITENPPRHLSARGLENTFFCTNLCYISQMAATTRNVFIANLALADLLLCLFTIPLTLIDLVNKYWGLAPGMVRPS